MSHSHSSLGFVVLKIVGRVLAFVDPVMHCALVIVISKYGHFEEWRNIIINIINVVRQYKPSFYKQCARCKKYMHRRHFTTMQHFLVQCNIKLTELRDRSLFILGVGTEEKRKTL
jgi:hypothetical protein